MAAPILGNPAPQFMDANGNPLVGGLVYVYAAGTSTPANSYPTSDDANAATNANSNPVVLDSNGYADGLWGVDNTSYYVVVKNSAGVTQWDSDDLYMNRQGTTGQTGFLELATNAEVITGTDTARAVTPAGVTAKLAEGLTNPTGLTASPRLCHTGAAPPQVSTDGTDQTPVATEVYICEVFVPCNMTVTGVAVMNGSAASGNYKVGLANSSGAVVATSASTAMSGTDAYQRVPFTATYAAKGPATYYVLLFVDNTTARINTHTFGDFGASKQTGQVYATGFTTITPPTTFTTALGTIASLY